MLNCGLSTSAPPSPGHHAWASACVVQALLFLAKRGVFVRSSAGLLAVVVFAVPLEVPPMRASMWRYGGGFAQCGWVPGGHPLRCCVMQRAGQLSAVGGAALCGLCVLAVLPLRYVVMAVAMCRAWGVRLQLLFCCAAGQVLGLWVGGLGLSPCCFRTCGAFLVGFFTGRDWPPLLVTSRPFEGLWT